MAEESLSITVRHLGDYQFNVAFDWPVPDILMDEPEPLGGRQGPNASRLLAAAVGNCLTASLLFCLQKAHVEAGGATTAVTASLERNEKGRLRISAMDARIELSGLADAAQKTARCNTLFEDFCVVTASVRQGIPVRVTIVDADGAVLHRSGGN
jgi:organic hydroperoxide reductase OsmC/OhrA